MHSRRMILGGSLSLAAYPAVSVGQALTVVRPPIFSQTIFYLPTWIAMEKGYFTEAGLSFDMEPGRTMAEASEALLNGTVPFASMGPEVVFRERAGADRIRIIAGNANRLPHFLIAQPKYKKISDLRGANIGVISDVEGTTFVFQKMAAAAGLKRSDYTISAVGGAPARVKLMDEGKIDAALQPFPLTYEAEAKGFTNLGWSGGVEPDWQFSVMIANREWLRAQPDVAVKILHATDLGRRFMTEHPDEAAEIAARRIKTTPALARRAIGDIARLEIMDPDLRWSPAGLKAVYSTLQLVGELPAGVPFKVADYVDEGPLTRALAMRSA